MIRFKSHATVYVALVMGLALSLGTAVLGGSVTPSGIHNSNTGDKIETSRRAALHSFHLQRSLERYSELEGKIPTSPLEELTQSGYLFYEPTYSEGTHADWYRVTKVAVENQGKGRYRFWVTFPDPDGSANYAREALVLAKPTTEEFQQFEEGMKRNTWMLVQREPQYFGDITKEDVVEGRFLYDGNGRELKFLSRSRADYAQLRWSVALLKLLTDFGKEFMRVHGVPAQSSRELEEFIGEKVEKGWFPPLNKNAVILVERFDGTNPAYVPILEGGKGFEVIVPLFGAGEAPVPENYRRFLRNYFGESNYAPGKFIRYVYFQSQARG